MNRSYGTRLFSSLADLEHCGFGLLFCQASLLCGLLGCLCLQTEFFSCLLQQEVLAGYMAESGGRDAILSKVFFTMAPKCCTSVAVVTGANYWEQVNTI